MTSCSPAEFVSLGERKVKNRCKGSALLRQLITSPNGFWLLYIGERLPQCFSHEYEWVIHEMISWLQIPSWRMHPSEKQSPTLRKGSLLYTLHFLKDFYVLLMLAQNLEVQTKSWCFFKRRDEKRWGFQTRKSSRLLQKNNWRYLYRLVFPSLTKGTPTRFLRFIHIPLAKLCMFPKIVGIPTKWDGL